MRHCIECFAIDSDSGIREFNIDIKGRVWPCCLFANMMGDPRDDYESRLSKSDKKINELFENNPNWNNLNYHSMDDITKNEIFWKHIWYPGWDSDTPPAICLESCSVNR